jgi:hypothetical protein
MARNKVKQNKMEQDIDTNELGEAIVKKLKQFMTLKSLDIYELGLI